MMCFRMMCFRMMCLMMVCLQCLPNQGSWTSRRVMTQCWPCTGSHQNKQMVICLVTIFSGLVTQCMTRAKSSAWTQHMKSLDCVSIVVPMCDICFLFYSLWSFCHAVKIYDEIFKLLSVSPAEMIKLRSRLVVSNFFWLRATFFLSEGMRGHNAFYYVADTTLESTKTNWRFYFTINSKDSNAILWLNIRSRFFNVKLKIICSQNQPSQVVISKAWAVLLLINFIAENDC